MVLKIVKMAEDISKKQWGFHANRSIKPVHLANGFFRALCGGQTGSTTLLQKAAGGYHTGRSRVTTEQFIDDIKDLYECEDRTKLFERAKDLRESLSLVLNQDGTFFPSSFSSATLTHRLHITSDPSDQGAGKVLAQILANSDPNTINCLRNCLDKDNDNIFILSYPLIDRTKELGPPPIANNGSNDNVNNSKFSKLVQTTFSNLMLYEQRMEKAMFLQRVVSLASFLIFLRLINQNEPSENQDNYVPILVCGNNPSPILREISRNTFILARQQIVKTYEKQLKIELQNRGQENLSKDEYLEIGREWLTDEGRLFENEFAQFSQIFEGMILGGLSLLDAFSHAIVRLMFMIMKNKGESPEGVAASLGRLSGLLYPRLGGRGGKSYLPGPTFLDMLVVSLLEPNEEVSLEEFWSRARKHYGVICGAQSIIDNEYLREWGIRSVSPKNLHANAQKLLSQFNSMGHALEFPDDIAVIHVGGLAHE